MARTVSLENILRSNVDLENQVSLTEDPVLVREVEILLKCLIAQLPDTHQDEQTQTTRITMDLVHQPRFITFPGLD